MSNRRRLARRIYFQNQIPSTYAAFRYETLRQLHRVYPKDKNDAKYAAPI